MTWIQRARRLGIGTAAVAVLSAGCSSDGPSGNDGAIDVDIAPASLTITRGGNGTVTVTLTREGGFSGAVTLTSTGLPTGITVGVVPSVLSGTTATATITVTVAANTTPGSYTATLTASAEGVGQATATYQVTVLEGSDFSLSVSPAARTIVPGGSSSATIGIARTFFPSAVELTLFNPPAGITGVFDPASSTTNGASLTINVAASVAPGVYPLTIRGTGTGPGTKSTTLTVTVPPPPVGGNVLYEFCDPAEAPVFVAYQNGTGAWQPVVGATSGGITRYTLNITQTRGGVMFVYPPAADIRAGFAGILKRQTTAVRSSATRTPALLEDAYVTQILYGTTVELAQDGAESCALTRPRRTIFATVAGVPPGAYGIFSAGGGATAFFDGAAPLNPIALDGVPLGEFDLVGARTVPGSAPTRTIVLRNLSVSTGGTLPTILDFNGPVSAPAATANVTIAGGAGDDLEAFVDLVTPNGGGGLWSDLSPSTTATRPWGGIANMLPGDLHSLVVFASSPLNFTDFRLAVKYVGPVTNQGMVLGPVINTPTSSPVAGGAYPRFRFQGTLPGDYNKGVAVEALGVENTGNIVSILATGAWLAAAGTPLAYDLTMPDVAGLTGFPMAARLTAGTNDLSVSGWGFTGTGVFDVRPALGSEFRAAVRGTTLVVP